MYYECTTEGSLGQEGVADYHRGEMVGDNAGLFTATFTTCQMPVYGMGGQLEYWQHVRVYDQYSTIAEADEYTTLSEGYSVPVIFNIYE